MVDICPFKAQERMNDVCKTRRYKQEGLPPFSGAALTIQFLYFCINLQ